VTFQNHGTVRKAVALTGQKLDEREVHVSKARNNPWKKGMKPGQWQKRGRAGALWHRIIPLHSRTPIHFALRDEGECLIMPYVA
jgi:hypothetical protein